MPFNAVFSHIIKKRLPRIQRFSKNPIECQRETLLFLISNGQQTSFGRKYNFDKITSKENFQNHKNSYIKKILHDLLFIVQIDHALFKLEKRRLRFQILPV